jgi:hypothetical protein
MFLLVLKCVQFCEVVDRFLCQCSKVYLVDLPTSRQRPGCSETDTIQYHHKHRLCVDTHPIMHGAPS